MTHITKLTEIIDGRLLPSDKKLSASLLEVDSGRLTVSENTLGFDATGLATETFVSNAIASAQLDGGEVDLSGYATKDDLAEYATTEELLGAFNEIATGMPLLVADEVNAAIASVVDGAPETFDTLKEIAEWIENDGVAATDLASAIADKADRSDLAEFKNEAEINTLIETYVMETYNPQLGSNITLLLDAKVDKVEGKGLSTEDFTTAYKTKLDGIDEDISTLAGAAIQPTVTALWEGIGGVSGVLETFDTQKLDIPTETDPSTITTPTINSIPLYTLGNSGEYVLCTPDTWFLINGFYVPGYSATTLGV